MASVVIYTHTAPVNLKVLKLSCITTLFTCSLKAIHDQRDEGYCWPTKQSLGKKIQPGVFLTCYYVFHNNLYQDSALGSFYRRTRMKTFFKRWHRKCHNFQWEHMYRVYHWHKSAKPQGRTGQNLSPRNAKFSWLWWERVTVMHEKEDMPEQSTFREIAQRTFCLKCAPN